MKIKNIKKRFAIVFKIHNSFDVSKEQENLDKAVVYGIYTFLFNQEKNSNE